MYNKIARRNVPFLLVRMMGLPSALATAHQLAGTGQGSTIALSIPPVQVHPIHKKKDSLRSPNFVSAPND